MKVVTSAQMREIDRRAIEACGVPGRELMESAGQAVAEAVLQLTDDKEDATATVFCGKGNNGGDGFVAARHLAQRGVSARIILAGPAAEVRGDAAYHLELARAAGVAVDEVAESLATWPGRAELAQAAVAADVLVDALLGTGARGEVAGLVGEMIDFINDAAARGRAPVVAADVPSGLDSDTGRVLGRAVRADRTVTMGLPKLGLLVGEGIACAGELTVADIGFPTEVIADSPAVAELTDPAWAYSVIPARRRDAHKGDCGRVAVIAGSVGLTGAAALCSIAALRMGAGLVTLGIPESLNDIMEVKLTEVMTRPLPETPHRSLAISAREQAVAMAHQADVVIVGPGLSRDAETMELVRELLAAIERPLVLDADGLNALQGDVSPLRERRAPTICTPHPGEMSRLLDVPVEAVQADRLGVAQRAAADLGCVIVLKGARTIIANPTGCAYINPTGNPGMASGGSGDVLAGMIGGLCAQSTVALDAAAAAAATFFHGLAGDLAACDLTEQCLIAGDILDYLPLALTQT